MLTVSSISPSNSPAPRPLVAAEVVRPVEPLRAIAPASAISKERSRTENKAANAPFGADPVYTPNGKRANADGRSVSDTDPDKGTQKPTDAENPEAEKSAIQKALDAQIKDLISNVWKASAKAVDFLLQRDNPQNQTKDLLNPATLSLRSALVLPPKSGPKAPADVEGEGAALDSYDARGAKRTGAGPAAGQLLSVLA